MFIKKKDAQIVFEGLTIKDSFTKKGGAASDASARLFLCPLLKKRELRRRLCASQRRDGEMSASGSAAVPRGNLRANLLMKDPASEHLIS